MKAKIRALAVLLILCISLALTYGLLPSAKPPAKPSDKAAAANAEQTITITDIPASEIQALAINNNHGTYGIINRPEGITVVPDTGANFSVRKMRALIYTASHLTGIRRLENYTIPSDDEIKNSLARFSLILSDGRENNFAILKKSPATNDYLLFFEEAKSVFVVSRSNAEWFLRGIGDFLE